MSAFRSFVAKETRHILRDRPTLAVLLGLPLVMVLLFGSVIRTGVDGVRTAVVVPPGDARAADLARAVAATPALRLVAVRASEAEVEPLLRAGRADVALVLAPGFARHLAAGRADVLVLADGTNPQFAQTATAYVRAVVQAWAAPPGAAPPVALAVRMRFNPTLESTHLFVPGLLAFVLTLVSGLMTALALAREKERGTLEVLLVSPLRPVQIVVGKVAPYLVLASVNALTALGAAVVVFGVPVRGSVALLLAATLVFVLASLALGVLIATRMPDQRSAMMAVLLGLLLPSMALTGFIFPISSMPSWLQPVTRAVPATWYLLIARGVMLKGVGLEVLSREMLVLSAMAAGLLVAAARAMPDRLR